VTFQTLCFSQGVQNLVGIGHCYKIITNTVYWRPRIDNTYVVHFCRAGRGPVAGTPESLKEFIDDSLKGGESGLNWDILKKEEQQ